MINEPVIVIEDGFQQVWLAAAKLLAESQWEARNLIVHIRNPELCDNSFHDRMSTFADTQGILGPKHVAYTVFPHGLYRYGGTAQEIFQRYNGPNGLYERLHRRKPDWGTYFRRMTHYGQGDSVVNQLENIIQAIRSRENINKAAFTIVIQKPGGETVRPLGGPCLNYMAVQLDSAPCLRLGLLAVYRNHDFLERAYGNYWGLCNLLCFLARQADAEPGPLTCVSSHAYVAGAKRALRAFVESL